MPSQEDLFVNKDQTKAMIRARVDLFEIETGDRGLISMKLSVGLKFERARGYVVALALVRCARPILRT